MKATRRGDGPYTISGVPEELLEALVSLAADLGERRCILRYDERDYGKWAQPNKLTRKALREFSSLINDWAVWHDYYDELDKPKFPKAVR